MLIRVVQYSELVALVEANLVAALSHVVHHSLDDTPLSEHLLQRESRCSTYKPYRFVLRGGHRVQEAQVVTQVLIAIELDKVTEGHEAIVCDVEVTILV